MLGFARDDSGIYAIHRVWTQKGRQERLWRLLHGQAHDRRFVTEGCVNVTPDVYEELVMCCSRLQLVVEP